MHPPAEKYIFAEKQCAELILLGTPDLDLFASTTSHQLQHYASWKPDPQSIGTDSMLLTLLDWTPYFPYISPHSAFKLTEN